MLTKTELRHMKEDALRRGVLLPLLRKMGFQDVDELHGATEFGKDIVGWKTYDLGTRRYTAIVAKATAISGQSSVAQGTVGEVQSQVREAFALEFADPATGQSARVHSVWVVTNKDISETARKKLVGVLGDLGRYVEFMGLDRLWGLCQQYLPERTLWEAVDEGYAQVANLDPHFDVEIRRFRDERSFMLHERYPGALDEHPLEFRAAFTFRDTPEDHEAKAAFLRHIDTGSPVELSGANVSHIELPEVMRRLTGPDTFPLERLQLGANPQAPPMLARLEVESEEAEHFAIPYLDLRVAQAGRRELTLTNDQQPIPFRLKIVLSPAENRGQTRMRFDSVPMNIAWYLRWLRFQACTSKPFVVRIVEFNSGVELFTIRWARGVGEAPAPAVRDACESLAAIQSRLRRFITVPDRTITPEEDEVIDQLHAIHRLGRLTGTWTEFSASIPRGEARAFLESFVAEPLRPLGLAGTQEMTLFGTVLPLGRAEMSLQQARMANLDEVRAALESGIDEKAEIPVRFAPGSDNTWEKRYLDWLPDQIEAHAEYPKEEA